MADSDTRVIVASRGKMALMCLGTIALAAMGGALISEPSSGDAVIAGCAALGLSGLFGVLWTLQLVWPSRLVLDRDGLVFHYLFATFRRRWIDVGQIDVVAIESTRFVKLVAKSGGRNLDLGGAWPLSPDELFALMEEYLVRFGQADAAEAEQISTR